MQRKLNLLNYLFFLIVFTSITHNSIAQNGEVLFKKCKSCHTIGNGNRKGPDLQGITNRRSEAWLIKFIKSSKSMFNSGDLDAVAICNEYKNSPMKDYNLSEEEIKNILAFIDGDTDGTAATEDNSVVAVNKSGDGTISSNDPDLEALNRRIDTLIAANSRESIQQGKNLFMGTARFKNGGIACIVCHSLTDQNVIDGGLLSRDLTKTFTPSGGHDGVNSLITEPPFPSMTETYKDHPVTAEEAAFLQLYLQDIEKVNAIEKPDSRWLLPQMALKGLAVIMLLIVTLWFKRKKRSVNYNIIRRQEKV